MKVVISALHFSWTTIGECFRRVRDEFGLDGVELSLASSFRRPHCTEEDLDDLRRLGPDSGLALSAHIWEDLAQLDEPTGEQALLGWLQTCGETGIRGLVLHGGSCADREDGIAHTRRTLARVLPRFEAAGVRLFLENHYAFDYQDCHELFSEPWEFQRVVDLGSPALGFCFDTGHGHMTRNWSDLIAELHPWLGYVHLADNHGEHDDHCMYGEGTVPWEPMLKQICDSGFDGEFCVEFPARENLDPFRACVANVRERYA